MRQLIKLSELRDMIEGVNQLVEEYEYGWSLSLAELLIKIEEHEKK